LSKEKADTLSRVLGTEMHKQGITTPARAAKFLATVAHESGEFRFQEEIASGAAYEGRRDLGNTQPGDGKRFKGRGYIQLTGRSNYKQASQALGIDFVKDPKRVAESLTMSAKVTCWWWKTHGCNQLADTPGEAGMIAVTRRVNGGTNGLDDRLRYYRRAVPLARFLVPKPIKKATKRPAPVKKTKAAVKKVTNTVAQNRAKAIAEKRRQPWTSNARLSPGLRAQLDKEGRITPHFTWNEWASKDGAPVPKSLRKNAIRAAWRLEQLRHELGDKPLSALSYYRSPSHNDAVGGARSSRHMSADAADFSKQTVDSFGRARFLKACEKLYKNDGIGQYPGGAVHIDTRGFKARWNSWTR
jgi:predicted chitinase/uncharacterized protein YcbK (DUF882 family)